MIKLLIFTCFAMPAAFAVECPSELKTFHIYAKSGKSFGCLDKWQQSLFAELGCPLSFIDGNPSGPQKETLLTANKIQLITGLVKAPQRNFQFSRPFAANRSFLYRRKDDPRWDQIRNWCDPIMQQATIISDAGIYIDEHVARLRTDKNCSKWFIESPRGLLQSFALLDAKRADLLISPELHLRRMPPEKRRQYTALRLPVDHGYLRIAFSSAVPATFVQSLNQLIEKKHALQPSICDMDAAEATAN